MALVDFEFHIDSTGTDHKKLFSEQVKNKCSQYANNIDDCLKSGIAISEDEFYIYALFEDFNANNPFYSSFKGFKQIATDRKNELGKIYRIEKTISFRYSGNPKIFITYAGCGVALNVSNRLFNLTQADYIRIPEKPGRPQKGTVAGKNKTLDFEYLASDGHRFIQVECKGAEGLNANIDSKIKDILAKKSAQPSGARDVSFGVIASVPVDPDGNNAKCIFVDPEIADLNVDPVQFRLSARLRYYGNRLATLGNSQWVKKIKQLFRDSNEGGYTTYVNSDFSQNQTLSEFIGIQAQRKLTNGYYFKCTVIETNSGRIFGRVQQTYDQTTYYFYGFIENIFDEFEFKTIASLLEYKVKQQVIEWNGTMRIWDGYLDKNDINLIGTLTVTETGEVSGLLKASQG
ncbi:MAG: hypothetical protein BGO69_18695 [Bacteroidetes bacterium 46-16]|nr:MAG: hypothetical protein BGO69_18695 [Bacteroidetes bacterium 46-16]